MIYVCIPARDEEKTLGPLLWRIRSVFTDPEFQRDFRILVADDGSSDRTSQVLERYKTAVPLEVFRWPHRRGYAATLEGLLREAVDRSRYPKRDLVVTLQADLTEHPDHLVPLVKAAEGGADLVGCGMEGGGRHSLLRCDGAVDWPPIWLGGFSKGRPSQIPFGVSVSTGLSYSGRRSGKRARDPY